jgi:hypothetical protein
MKTKSTSITNDIHNVLENVLNPKRDIKQKIKTIIVTTNLPNNPDGIKIIINIIIANISLIEGCNL